MKRKKLSLAILSIVLGITLILCYSTAEQLLTVKRKCAIARTGPGSYYPSIAELPEGMKINVLEERNGWYKIMIDTLAGYVSKKVTQGKTEKEDIFSQMASQETTIRVSQVGLSAGIKGFGEKFSKRLKGDTEFIEFALSYQIDPSKYTQFKKETYTYFDINKIQKQIELPPSKIPLFFSFSEEGMGLGIASKISELGVYQNKSVQDYVNYVGHLVVEASNAYDISFKFFILDIPYANAYSCPGGIVFITKSMLENLQSEAELACVLGHEIAHIARYHGMKELEERKVEIIAEDSFMELDEMCDTLFATEDDSMFKEVELELEDMALSIYEDIFAGRLEEYEDEADELGLLYAARAGYSPFAMQKLLSRMNAEGVTSNNEHYTKDQIVWRKQLIGNFLDSKKFPEGLIRNQQRLQRYFSNLQ